MKNNNSPTRLAVSALFCLLFFASCQQGGRKEEPASGAAGGNENMLTRATIQYAHGFSIEYHDHFKLVGVLNKLAANTDTLRYLLVQDGYPVPTGYPGTQVIHIPVKTIIGMSSMHVALADFAGVADRITGMGSLAYISSAEVRKNVKAGKV